MSVSFNNITAGGIRTMLRFLPIDDGMSLGCTSKVLNWAVNEELKHIINTFIHVVHEKLKENGISWEESKDFLSLTYLKNRVININKQFRKLGDEELILLKNIEAPEFFQGVIQASIVFKKTLDKNTYNDQILEDVDELLELGEYKTACEAALLIQSFEFKDQAFEKINRYLHDQISDLIKMGRYRLAMRMTMNLKDHHLIHLKYSPVKWMFTEDEINIVKKIPLKLSAAFNLVLHILESKCLEKLQDFDDLPKLEKASKLMEILIEADRVEEARELLKGYIVDDAEEQGHVDSRHQLESFRGIILPHLMNRNSISEAREAAFELRVEYHQSVALYDIIKSRIERGHLEDLDEIAFDISNEEIQSSALQLITLAREISDE